MIMMTSQAQIRDAFWRLHPEFNRKRNKNQNDYSTNIRCSFIDFLDFLYRDNQINASLANRATL